MSALDALRDRTLTCLGRHYAAGHVATGTFEIRVDAALTARTPLALKDVLWDLPTGRARPRAICSALVVDGCGGAVLDLDEDPRSWLVGRSRSCDVVLADPAVSRRHVLVSMRGGRCSVLDLNSANGLALNGRRVRTAALRPGDVLTLGQSVDVAVR